MISPAPYANKREMKAARHIHDGIGVAGPNPPQTPPIQRSLDDFVARFKSHVLIIVSDGFLSATPTRITDSRWERALAANPVREQPGAS
jgi:hypothetical protein